MSLTTQATVNHLRATKDALDAIVTTLRALQWDPVGAAPPQNAFARVELFDDLDLAEAFKQLIMSESRIALVIFSDEPFTTEKNGRQLIIHRQHRLWIVFTDRVVGKRMDALMGGATNPGLLVLRDLVLPAISGLTLTSAQKVSCTPLDGSLLRVEGTDKTSPGRLAYSLEVQLDGGYMLVDTGRSPIL
jgi:hypothetical protein